MMSVPIVMAGYGAYVLAIALAGLSVYIVHLNELNIIPLILCVPIVLIAIGGYVAYFGYLLALVLLSIGISIGIVVVYALRSWGESLRTVTDISRYQEIRSYFINAWVDRVESLSIFEHRSSLLSLLLALISIA